MMYALNKKGAFRRFLAGFIVLVLLVAMFVPPMYTASAASEDLNDVSTITGAGLSKGGASVNGTTVNSTDTLVLRYDFEIKDLLADAMVANVGGDGTTEYPVEIVLPHGLKWTDSSGTTVQMNDGDGKKIGELRITSSIVAVLVFGGNYWDDYSDLNNAHVYLNCALDLAAIAGAQTLPITLMGGTVLNITVGDNKPKAHEVKKAGTYNATTNRFEWTVTLTPGDDVSKLPFTLKDTITDGNHVFVDGSFKVAGVTESETITDAGTKLEYAIATAVSGTPIIFTYETAISDEKLKDSAGSAITARNAAVIEDSDGVAVAPAAAANATATAANTRWLAKNGVVAADGRSINWTVTIITNDRKLDNLKMFDTLPTGLALDTSSVQINGDTIASLASAGAALDTTTAPPKFVVTIPKDGPGSTYKQKYVITYTTEVDASHFDKADGNINFVNAAELEYTWTHHYGPGTGSVSFTLPTIGTGVDVNTNIIQKRATNYNRATHEITWEVTVNPYKVDVISGTITDPLDAVAGKEQTYVGGSFECLTSPLITTTAAADGSAVPVAVGNIGANTHTYTFRTKVVADAHFAFNTTTEYTNTVSFDGSVRVSGNPESVTDSATAKVDVVSKVVEKTGSGYDVATNIVTWKVTVNQNKMPMTDVELFEEIQPNQTFVPGSVKIGINGAPLTDANASDVGYDSIAGELTITLGTITGNEIVVTYQTELDVDNITDFKSETLFTVPNAVTLSRDEHGSLEVTGTQATNNQMLKKVGNRSGNTINYSVEINPNGLTLQAGTTIVDTLPNGLMLDIDTVKLYAATVNAAGAFTQGSEISLGTWSWQNNAAADKFSVTLPAGAARYILEFDCEIADASQAPFVNKIAFDSGDITGDAGEADGNSVAAGAGAGGSGSLSNKAKLVITKEDSIRGIKLAGVEFELWTVLNGEDTIVATDTTNALGQITFFPLTVNREYWLVESGPLAGYTNPEVGGTALDADYIIKATTNKQVIAITITNVPEEGAVSFVKVNNEGSPLEGVSFTIEDVTTGTYTQTATSNALGVVAFTGVPFGEYTLEEDYKVVGHALNTEVFKLTVDADGITYEIVDSADAPLQNGNEIVNIIDARGDIEVTIFVSGSSTPLAGRTFRLVDALGNVIQEETSGADGKLSFLDVALGVAYQIVEIDQSGSYVNSPPVPVKLPEGLGGAEEIDWPKVPYTGNQGGFTSGSNIDRPTQNNNPNPVQPSNPATPGEQPQPTNPTTPGQPTTPGTTDPGTTQPVTPGDLPKTGDSAKTALWFLVCAASFAGLCMVMKVRKKSHK